MAARWRRAGGGPAADSSKRTAAEDEAVEQQDNLNLQEVFDLQNNTLQALTEDEGPTPCC